MKNVIHSLSVLLLGGLVLLVNSGLSISVMACHMSGESEWAIGAMDDDCCEDKSHSDFELSSKCCDANVLDFNSSQFLLKELGKRAHV